MQRQGWLCSSRKSPKNINNSSAELRIHPIFTPWHLSIQQTYTDEVFLNNFYKWESHLLFWKERHGLWKVYLSICWRCHTLTRECKKQRVVLQPNPKLTAVWTSVKAICFAKTPLLLHFFFFLNRSTKSNSSKAAVIFISENRSHSHLPHSGKLSDQKSEKQGNTTVCNTN